MTCDHGITLDRYCEPCEAAFRLEDDPQTLDPEVSRVVVLVAVALLCLIALYLGAKR